MNKKVVVVIAICLLTIIASGIGIKSSGILDPYEQQIKLGYKLMNEGNYEEAILAFNKAVEIDIKRDKGYIGLADNSVARGNENTIDEVSEALQRGYEQSESENIIMAYIRIADTFIQMDKTEWAMRLLEYGYVLTGDERIKSKRDKFIESISSEFMKSLYLICESNDIDAIKEVMRSEEYRNISIYATAEDPLFYSPDSVKVNKNGKGVGIYEIGSVSSGSFIYFGDYVDNTRHGNGIWLRVDDEYQYLFNGKWVNDTPNGYGEVNYVMFDDYTGDNYTRIEQGVLSNGLWNGDITWSAFCSDAFTDKFIINFSDGLAQVLEVEEKEGETLYIVSIMNDGDETMGFYEDGINVEHGINGFTNLE